MLEITAEDIADLSDDDLRSLVGLLCEAEVQKFGYSPSAVTWGGDQNAPDGGIDVRVALPPGTVISGFIPRPLVGFQAKKSDVTPRLIGPEMRPGGELRASIRDLANGSGTYIIVSSGSNTSDSALDDRRVAMRQALSDLGNANDLHTEFYDRNRIATWSRSHPGLILWVRAHIGRGASGWRTHEAWAYSPEGVGDSYLLDDKARLHTGRSDETGIPVLEGIKRIRATLRQPRGIVRLAGLSGVGKTRLVQALFDRRVAEESLDPSFAVYTDMADNPNPQPIGMASDLIAARAKAFLVIDNCPPDLHRRLSEVCRAAESTVSAITVEYDIRDDEPEGAEVYRLEPSSPELVAELVQRRFKDISEVDVRTIANFSGGNARIGLALASTLERNETISGLREDELFRRLFHQRQSHDESLLKAAQACALLYSFQGEALTGDDAELPHVAALAGMSAQELFGKVAELKRRDLVQRRSVWRAVLPHAIANRLAAMALQNIPIEAIEAQFNTDRLLRSFSRRLGYLHDSAEAVRVVKRWMGSGGMLENFARLNDLGMAMFGNIAPVAPLATLGALERALQGPDASRVVDNSFQRNRVAALLRSLAYEPFLFERCVALLVTLAIAEAREGRSHNNTAENLLAGLFHLYLSGTLAPIEQRIPPVEALLRSDDGEGRLLGVKLLKALLHSDHFFSDHGFEFGARSRDYGYIPKLEAEVRHWYSRVLTMAGPLASSDRVAAPAVRQAIAESFRGLWARGLIDQFEGIAREILAKQYWEEGWIGVRRVLRFPPKNPNEKVMARLQKLEKLFRPASISQKVYAIVLPESWGPFDYADSDESDDNKNPMAAYERANDLAKELGNEVGKDTSGMLGRLARDLIAGKGNRTAAFGQGLSAGVPDKRAAWNTLLSALVDAPVEEQNIGVLCGFLGATHAADPQFCETALDESLVGGPLARWFPSLQSCIPIDEKGVSRLKQSIELGHASVHLYQFLGGDRSTEAISGKDLKHLLLSVAARPGGFKIAIDAVSMRLHRDKNQKIEYPPELLECGRELLSRAEFDDRDHMHDYRLKTVVKGCLIGLQGEKAGRALCQRFKEAVASHVTYSFNYGEFLAALFATQPVVALDVFFGRDEGERRLGITTFETIDDEDNRASPIDGVPDDIVLRWCKGDRAARFSVMARAITYYRAAKDGPPQWTPLALRLIEMAPDPVAVLEIFIDRFSPGSWSGSRAAIIERRLSLLDHFANHSNGALSVLVARMRSELRQKIQQEREWETKRDQDRDEKFE